MHSLLRSRQGEIDLVCSQLHTGYSRSELHLCQDSGNSASTCTSSVLENEVDDTLSLFNKKTKTKKKTRLLHPRCKTNDYKIDLISFNFEKKSYITRDTEAPGPLSNVYFKLQLRILTHYSPFTLLVTAIYTKCFFLFPICVKQN